MLLRNSKHKGSADFNSVQTLAKAGLPGSEDRARREEFIELVKKAKQLKSAQQ